MKFNESKRSALLAGTLVGLVVVVTVLAFTVAVVWWCR